MRFGDGRTADERQNTFEAELAAAVAGKPLRMHVGMGPDTDAALIAIALAHPDVTPDMIATASRAFAAESVSAEPDAAGTPEELAVLPDASR